MSWNAKPQNTLLPPPYRKIQPALSQQYAANQLSTTSQSSFGYPTSNQACMYTTNSNPVSQPLLNVRNYNIPPPIPASNMPNRTVVASQTSVERTVHTNAKGPTQPSHNLQTASGLTQNMRLNSSMMNSMPSQMEATVSHPTNFGTNPAHTRVLQSQCVASDTYSMQLQVSPNSARPPVALQGSQGLNQLLPNQQVDWVRPHASDELTYPEYRPLPKQHSFLAQSFVQDPSSHKKIHMPSAPSQVMNHQLPASAQSNQAAAVSYPCALQPNTRPPPPPYCRYGSQPLQNPPHGSKLLSMEVPQSPEIHSSEVKKDFSQGFQQQWQSTNENFLTIGNFCDVKVDANIRQPFIEPSRSVDGVQTLSQNNEEKRMDSCNPSSSQGLDTTVAKEKLARDIKSLIEMKKKFSELARKIRIDKGLLMAAGCKSSNSLSAEPAQHPEFSEKEISAKSHCSMELVKTCLNLWKKQPSKMTEEKASKPAEEKQGNESVTNPPAGISKPVEVAVQNPCAVERNPQDRTANPVQEAALSMLVQNYDSPCAYVTKGTELQIAVVSPLILSNVIKEITPGGLPETVYPVIKEGSICSLENQPAENPTVPAAVKVDVIKPAANPATSAKVFPLVQKEKQNEPNDGNSQDTPGAHREQHCCPDHPQTSSKPKDRTLVSGNLLQIENICSLVEGDVSYNSRIAKMFNSPLLETVEPRKFSLPSQQAISTGHQKEQVEQAPETKDFCFQNDKCIQYTDFPYEIVVMGKKKPPALPGSSFESVEPGVLEESKLETTTNSEGLAKDAHCSPASAVQQGICSGDTDTSSNDTAQNPAASEIHDDHTPALYLHDQLSELLKEFPYGIEGVNACESFVSQKKAEQILEDQTGGNKSDCGSKEPTDQIKITILSSEQMKELFPEQDTPGGGDTPRPPSTGQLAEPQGKKHVVEVGSQCDPQTPTGGESPDPVVDSDKIHCCALGWLAMIYEGVPKCRCNTAEEGQGKEPQSPLEISSCKQGQETSDAGVAVVKCDGVSNNPKMPETATAEKTHLPQIHGGNIKDASKTRKDSTQRRRHEFSGQTPAKCKSSDKRDPSEAKPAASANGGKELIGRFSSKHEPAPSQSKKGVKLKFHVVHFQSTDKMTFSDQASQEGPQKKHTLQNSHPINSKAGLFSNKDPCRKNGSLEQSLSPEKKKMKCKESSPQEGHSGKRKLNQGKIPDLEIKKKKCDKQEQNKNAGGTVKLCNTLPTLNERAIVKENSMLNTKSSDSKDTSARPIIKEKTVSPMKSDLKDTDKRAIVKDKTASQTRSPDSKDPSQRGSIREKTASPMKSLGSKNVACKFKRVITLQEYYQRKKEKEAMAKKICLKSVAGDSTSSGSRTLCAQVESCKNSSDKGGSGVQTSSDPSSVCINPGKDLKTHLPEDSNTCNPLRHVEGRVGVKQLVKTKSDNTLGNMSNEMAPRAKEQRKSYLNRLSFRCTERESICLTTLDSSPRKLGKDKGQEQRPRASFPGKDSTAKAGMLEFKLCPDVLLKNANSAEDKYDLKAHPEEQATAQVSGIKSSRKDWIKFAAVKKTMQETSEEIGVNSRLLQRSASAEGREMQQTPVRDSQAMFQTYKQLYLQKRGRSLGSSPVQ